MSTRRVFPSTLKFHPRYVVWELTLRCDQFCTHCGSRAGDPRATELSESDALDVVEQLAAMGTRDVALIGGEAYLHPSFFSVVRALKQAGIRTSMTTGGMGVTKELAHKLRTFGMDSVSVSVDGLEVAHDLIRGNKGSFQGTMRALDALQEAGIWASANTNINRVNRDDLESLFALLLDKGVRSWQVQITVPLGRAADRPKMLLQPYDLLDVLPRIAALKKKGFAHDMLVMPGNNLGYFGPEEALLRSQTPEGKDHWMGCQAGRLIMGIESDGAIKGCPSLQSKDYIGGNIQEQALQEIWEHAPELGFARERTTSDLWGFCATCPFAENCLGGCSFTAHALFGRPGNNPYCHFRARHFAKQGKRERLVPVSAASGLPFDHALFHIEVEELPTEKNLPSQTLSSETTPKKELAALLRKFHFQREHTSQGCTGCPKLSSF